MLYSKYFSFICSLSLCYTLIICSEENLDLDDYRPSPKLMGPKRFKHSEDDTTLNKLDDSLAKISTIYMQALFSGTHSAKLDMNMRKLEIELFDLLDVLYKENRLKDYMKYEAEVTRQMILYNMLKKLFGFGGEDSEKVT
ncbi:uncharacterized protein LOC142238705 [Haematobia irritans]|uniref:uncharacterized protein LOC142238705 n=1 Tax=Haematobia irritans TaxID=7368 RepID=UPI003F4F5576